MHSPNIAAATYSQLHQHEEGGRQRLINESITMTPVQTFQDYSSQVPTVGYTNQIPHNAATIIEDFDVETLPPMRVDDYQISGYRR